MAALENPLRVIWHHLLLAPEAGANRMDIYNGHNEPNIHQPGVFFAGLRIAQSIIRWLIRTVIPTEQELAEAGVYLGKMHN